MQDLFLNATIMITFITLGNQFYFRDREINKTSSLRSKIIFGLMNGALGCFLMLYSVTVLTNVMVDFRNVAIILASIFGGFISSIIASLLIGVFRILYFGVTASSITALIAAVILGVGCPIITSRLISAQKKWTYSTLFCIAVGSIGYITLIKETGLLVKLLAAYWLGSFAVTIVIYRYIDYIFTSNALVRKYKEEASKDFLTGLNNVRQFDKSFNAVVEKIQENEEKLALLFIDIDYFKAVNDTYGHAEGDLVLKEFGEILLRSCRDFDVVSRLGGEEFSVMLRDCVPQQALNIAERIRANVEQHPFRLTNGRTIHITVSVGVATYPDKTEDLSELINDADNAAYEAKRTGRNKVVY